jgi:hypothetical protein
MTAPKRLVRLVMEMAEGMMDVIELKADHNILRDLGGKVNRLAIRGTRCLINVILSGFVLSCLTL